MRFFRKITGTKEAKLPMEKHILIFVENIVGIYIILSIYNIDGIHLLAYCANSA
jgi:hypothetical protein